MTMGGMSTRQETSVNETRLDQLRSQMNSQQAGAEYASLTGPSSPAIINKSRGMTGIGARKRTIDIGQPQNWQVRRNTMNQSAMRNGTG